MSLLDADFTESSGDSPFDRVEAAKKSGDLTSYKQALDDFLNVEGIDEKGRSSLLYDLDNIQADCERYFPEDPDAFREVMEYLKAMANSEDLYKRLDTAHSKALGIEPPPPEPY